MLKMIVDYCLEFVKDKDLLGNINVVGSAGYENYVGGMRTLVKSYKVSLCSGEEIFTVVCHGGNPEYALGYTLTVNDVDYNWTMFPLPKKVEDLFCKCRQIKEIHDTASEDEKSSLAYLQQMKRKIQNHDNSIGY